MDSSGGVDGQTRQESTLGGTPSGPAPVGEKPRVLSQCPEVVFGGGALSTEDAPQAFDIQACGDPIGGLIRSIDQESRGI